MGEEGSREKGIDGEGESIDRREGRLKWVK